MAGGRWGSALVLGTVLVGASLLAGGGAAAASPVVPDSGPSAGGDSVVVPGSVEGFTSVSAGGDHTVLLAGGGVFAWGANTEGQLGDGTTTTTPRAAPTRVDLPSGVRVTAIAAGDQYTVALADDGSVYAWGRNSEGELGDGTTTTSRAAPARVDLPSGVRVTAIAAGDQYTVALADDGSVYAWGDNTHGQLGDGAAAATLRATPTRVDLPSGVRVTAIAAGGAHTVALADDGGVYAWGDNGEGELGDGTTAPSATPTRVDLPSGVRVTAIAAGDQYTVALADEGSVYAWGDNTHGQLGDGTTESHDAPVPVGSLSGARVSAIAAGDQHTVALADEGSVYAWGDNTHGQLGDGTTQSRTSPIPVPLPRRFSFSQIAAGEAHTVALADDGSVYAWGRNTEGELGDGTSATTRAAPTRVDLPSGVRVTAIAAGKVHTVALADDGSVYAWGDNTYRQLGDGTVTNADTPVAVALPPGVRITAIAAGAYHTVALADDGSVYAWGDNTYGQLGDGTTTTPRAAPARVDLPSGVRVTAIAAGEAHTVALADDGSVYAWGYNGYGQLGDGTTVTIRTAPVGADLPSGVRVTAIAAGVYHTVALADGGRLYAWGDNIDGELGIGTHRSHDTPVPVNFSSRARITAIAARGLHTVALEGDGAVWAWGDNAHGQLGDTTTTDRVNPTPVESLSGVPITAIAAGDQHTIAVADDDRVYTWGDNGSGQLGDGTTTGRDKPGPIVAPSVKVAFGDTPAVSTSIDADGVLHAVTPAHDPGPVDVTVTTGANYDAPLTWTIPAGYTFTQQPVFTTTDTALTVTAGDDLSYRFTADAYPAAGFTATGLPSWLTLDPDGLLHGTAPLTAGTSTIIVTATNTAGTAATVPITVSVTLRDFAPGASAAILGDPLDGATLRAHTSGLAPDVEEDELDYAWSLNGTPVSTDPDWTVTDGANGTITLAITAHKAGYAPLALTAEPVQVTPPALTITGGARAGDTITIDGSGFATDDYALTLHSEPVTLGTAAPDPTTHGFHVTLHLPADTTVGEHTIEADSTSLPTPIHAASTPFAVAAAPAGPSSTGPAGSSSTGPAGLPSTGPAGLPSTGPAGLPSTGVDIVPWIVIALLLAGIGLAAFLAARRTRA